MTLFARLLVVLALSATPLPAFAQDAADFVVRLNRLEGQVRQLSGQIEQLEFDNRQLREQLRKFQEDVEFRFSEAPGAPPALRPAPAPAPAPPAPPAPPGRRGDAFDPNTDPRAPGAPRQLGTTTPSAPLTVPGAVLGSPASIGDILEENSLQENSLQENSPAERPLREGSLGENPAREPGAPLDLRAIQRGDAGAPHPAPSGRSGPSVAATGSADPRADYDSAYAYLLQKHYERAEMGFRQFLQSHPRDALVPDAVFWLGETYAQRNRHREAAEQFLKVTTEHERSGKAPDAMLKLGAALNALGAREQACATFAEIERKYPRAGGNVREGVEREQRRARCAA